MKRLFAIVSPLFAIGLIGAGVAAHSTSAAAIVIGSLIWIDITIENYRHDLRKHDRSGH